MEVLLLVELTDVEVEDDVEVVVEPEVLKLFHLNVPGLVSFS